MVLEMYVFDEGFYFIWIDESENRPLIVLDQIK